MNQRNNLDILRAMAVCAVLLAHLFLTLHVHYGILANDHIPFLFALGQAGVVAFFVHTSLVLMYSLERMYLQSPAVIAPFYVRRFFRIYPLAIAVILLLVTLRIPSNTWAEPVPRSPAVVIANLFLVQNIFTRHQVLSPLWSLPCEVQMYVVLPFLFFLDRQRHARTYLFLIFGFFCILSLIVLSWSGHPNTIAYVPCFLCGVLCYSLRSVTWLKWSGFLWTPFLLGLVFAFMLANKDTKEPTLWSRWLFTLLLGVGINAFRDSKIVALNAVAGKVALYSYGVYLVHVPILYLVVVKPEVTHPALGVVAFLLLTPIAAVFAFHCVELPFINLGRRLSTTELRESSQHLAPILNQ